MSDIQPTYVRFPRDLHNEVKAYAAANDLTMAQVIRHATRSFMAGPSTNPTVVVNTASTADPSKVGEAVAAALGPKKRPVVVNGCNHPNARVVSAGLKKCDDCGATKGPKGWR